MKKPNKVLLKESQEFTSGMGAIAWATLETLKQGGLPAKDLAKLFEQMKKYFGEPSDEACNEILRVVESRLESDKIPGKAAWY